VSIRRPKVSVCIPTYNRPDYLRQSIESVLSQSFSDYELIISNNASEDSTAAVIGSFKDFRIVHIKKEKNIGLVENFNSCLAAAKGEFITVFHDDDHMLPDNLSLKVRALEKNERAGLVHSNFNIMDENGSTIKKSAHFIDSQDFVEQGSSFLRKSLLGFNPVNPPSAFIRKECFDKLGGFSSKVHFTTDWEYWMRIAIHYDVIYLAKPLIAYRMYHHSGWTSSKYLTMVGDDIFCNFNGLKDEYAAKKIILQKSKHILKDWKDINLSVRKNMINSVNRLVVKTYLTNGEKRKALEDIWEILRIYPELMFQISTVKLIVKIIIGLRKADLLKKFIPLGHRSN
jgi:glycosyltransferase involved in cell wall biosynthesis